MIRHLLASGRRIGSTFGRPARSKLTAALLIAGAFLVISATDGSAKASVISGCTPTYVWFDGYSGGRLAIFCNGEYNIANAFMADVNETACPGKNSSLDVIKVWTSMAMAYQLAGRKITMDYNDPSGTCTIKTIINIRNF